MKKNSIIKYWGNVRALTLRLLELFPEDKMDFAPVAGIRTVAEQFDHILSVELYARKGLTDNAWGPVPTPGLGYKTKAALLEKLSGEHVETARMLRMLPELAFTGFYETRFGHLTGEGMLYLAVDEEIHHRGNLYIYLRILGLKPPQMIHNYYQLFLED